MKRTDIIFVLILLTLVLFAIETLVLPHVDNEHVKKYGYTKTICEGVSCEDYFIECSGSQLIKKTFTGFSIEREKASIDLKEESYC